MIIQYQLEEPTVHSDTQAGIEDVEEQEAMSAVPDSESSKTQKEKARRARGKASVVVKHIDIIKDDFWERRPWILSGKAGKPLVVEDR